MESETVVADSSRLVARVAPDVVLAAGLVVGSFVLRWPGRPTDGIWYDDAWVAIGAMKGSIAEIPMTGGAHAGFTFALWLQHHLLGGGPERLALLAMVFGVIGPAVLFGCLRFLRYGRVGTMLAAAALLVTPSHVRYSGRVKSYTLDVVFVIVLATMLPRLADRRWTWAAAAGWVGFALVLGSVSGYVMLATALAIGILVLHPNGDRWPRMVALAVQGTLQGAWVLYIRRFADMDEIEVFMEEAFDAHVERSANPIVLAQNLLRHFERVVDVHPGAPSSLLAMLAIAVLAGLAAVALGRLDRPRAIVSRFALAALAVAALGSLLDRFPFGPRTFDLATQMGAPGARHGLWLVPITAIGVCNLVELAVRAAGPRRVLVHTFQGLVVAATVLLVINRWEPAERYSAPGARHLVAVVERAADRGALIVLDKQTAYQFVVLTDRSVDLAPLPEEMVGYLPALPPDQGVVLGVVFTPADVVRYAGSVDSDLLVFHGLDVPYADELTAEGWTQESTEEIGDVRVSVWRRNDTT